MLALLAHGLFQLLALAGLTPQVQACCLTQRPLRPDFTDPNWQVGFSITAGGTICLRAWEDLKKQQTIPNFARTQTGKHHGGVSPQNQATLSSQSTYFLPSNHGLDWETTLHQQETPPLSRRLNAKELAMLQQLSQSEIMQDATRDGGWLSVEQILRQYAQYHFGRPIRSAALIDSYFAANHDATL